MIFLSQIVKDDPFFGDAISSTSRAVNNIYNHQLLTIFYPTDADPGHPTLYAWLMALAWEIFGRTVFISHLFSIAWLMLLLLMFRKIAKLFLFDETLLNKASLLVLVMPTFISQGAMMLNTVAVMTFFLAAFYSLLTKKKWWFLFGSVLMVITHLQGCFFLLALAATDFSLSYKEKTIVNWIKERAFFYSIPALVFCAWLALHYNHTGWYTHSPNYGDIDEINTPLQFFKSLLLIIWRLVDFGMLPFYFIFLFAVVKNIGDKKFQHSWIVLTIVVSILMAVFLKNTIGHRYFLSLNLLMIISVINALQYFNKRSANTLYFILLLSLIAGNFLYYPGKNLGDGTIAYRGYFNIENHLKNEFSDTTVFWSYAPIANPSQLMYLNNEGIKTERINEQPIDSLPAIIQSNLNAEFNEEDKQYLAEHFYGKSYENGAVYVTIFLNPKFYPKPQNWKLREPSSIEIWMIKLKKKIKG